MKIIVTMSVILFNVWDEFTMIRVYIEKKMINENNLGRSEFDDTTKNILINLFAIVNIVSQFQFISKSLHLLFILTIQSRK